MTPYNGILHWGQRKVIKEHVNGEALKVSLLEIPFTYTGPYKRVALTMMNRAILGKITKEVSYMIYDADFDRGILEVKSYASV